MDFHYNYNIIQIPQRDLLELSQSSLYLFFTAWPLPLNFHPRVPMVKPLWPQRTTMPIR